MGKLSKKFDSGLIFAWGYVASVIAFLIILGFVIKEMS